MPDTPPSRTRTHRALIVVDVQNDFCEGGALGVEGGNRVAERIAEWLPSSRDDYDVVVATADYHIDPGSHFASEGEVPDFRSSWPPHCRAGTTGSDFHRALGAAFDSGLFDAVFAKGHFTDAYSAFEAIRHGGDIPTDQSEVESAHARGANLTTYLKEHQITDIDVVGLALDFCVRETAEDATRAGAGVRVLTDLTAGVAPETSAAALDTFERIGAQTQSSAEIG